MRWSNVFVIVRREVRDQIRDRRTLFMVFILPVLLYPVLAISLLKLQAEFEQKARRVLVVGSQYLPESPRLLNERSDGFEAALFDSRDEAELMQVVARPAEGDWAKPDRARELIPRTIRGGEFDAVVIVPPDLRSNLDRLTEEQLPVYYESTHEQSQTTYLRVKEVISRWRGQIVDARVSARQLPSTFTEPINVKGQDVAPEEEQGGNVWARLFPFLIVMMSLTGAFYPAIDLCAGEKERGTMETLLISPASRGEIVMGKFLTVVLASMTTALLNILSMGLTGVQMAKQLGAMNLGVRATESVLSPPSLVSVFWMVLLLVPLSVFFSALCVALAVLAKSMKEGQYYMTPLYLCCIPLVFLTLAPGIELNLFYSLVPVTGVSLLLRSLMLREYDVALHYFIPVLFPIVVYGAVALRWAVDQFHREDVLFREAERFDLKLWVRHLVRDKEPTPTAGQAILCFALMLTLAWFLIQYLAMNGMASSLTGVAIGQVAFILAPPLAMALLLTSSPRRTLRLQLPRGSYVVLALGLVFALNPVVNELGEVVSRLFPLTRTIKAAMEHMVTNAPSLGVAVLLIAVVPAVCEELAFRGFILSGLERGGDRSRSAILLSALLFAFLHVLISLTQQFFNAALLGIVLGLLAVRSRSIWPGILFHFVNNAMAVALPYWRETAAGARIAGWLYRDPAKGLYHGGLVVLSVLVSAALLAALWRSRGAGKPRVSGERLVSEPVMTAG